MRARPCRSSPSVPRAAARRSASGARSPMWARPSPRTSAWSRSPRARRSCGSSGRERGARAPGPRGAGARLLPLQQVPSGRGPRGGRWPRLRGDERRERVVRAHGLRGADGDRGGGRGRGARVPPHRGHDGCGSTGVALRCVRPIAGRVRPRPRGHRGGPENRAALGAARPAARRVRAHGARPMRGRRAAALGGLLLAAACVERVAAPGSCPTYCPAGAITIVDTLLTTAISRDSAFRGYVRPHQASVMLAATLPGVVDGRSLFAFSGFGSRFRLTTTDTTTGAFLRADSGRLLVEAARRDTGAHNLTLRLARMPVTIDSDTTVD